MLAQELVEVVLDENNDDDVLQRLRFLILLAVARMRRERAVAAVLIPFCIASFINNAQGIELFKFVLLGILLFAFGWRRDRGPAELSAQLSPAPAPSLPAARPTRATHLERAAHRPWVNEWQLGQRLQGSARPGDQSRHRSGRHVRPRWPRLSARRPVRRHSGSPVTHRRACGPNFSHRSRPHSLRVWSQPTTSLCSQGGTT